MLSGAGGPPPLPHGGRLRSGRFSPDPARGFAPSEPFAAPPRPPGADRGGGARPPRGTSREREDRRRGPPCRGPAGLSTDAPLGRRTSRPLRRPGTFGPPKVLPGPGDRAAAPGTPSRTRRFTLHPAPHFRRPAAPAGSESGGLSRGGTRCGPPGSLASGRRPSRRMGGPLRGLRHRPPLHGPRPDRPPAPDPARPGGGGPSPGGAPPGGLGLDASGAHPGGGVPDGTGKCHGLH